MSETIQSQPTPTEGDWQLIISKLARRRCVPFLGAGASLGFGGVGLPTGAELARRLADECDFPGPDKSDLFRVAQYYRMKLDEDLLRASVCDALNVPGVGPSAVHQNLAVLPVEYVLTTNFDNLMERGFREFGRKRPKAYEYQRRGTMSDLENATEGEPIVYKLHGSVDDPQSMVLTEDDVVDFLACIIAQEPKIPSAINRLFKDYSILFIGYGLKDLNIRVMLRVLRARRDGTAGAEAIAIQRAPDDENLAKEWQRTVIFRAREALRCYSLDANAFVAELRQRYEAAYPAVARV